MKKIMNTIIILGILGMSTLGGSTFIKADEIGDTVATKSVEAVNNNVNTNTQTTTHHFHPPVYSFVRGTVGKYGKRPIIYKNNMTAKQWNCYISVSQASVFASPFGPYAILSAGLQSIYSNCR